MVIAMLTALAYYCGLFIGSCVVDRATDPGEVHSDPDPNFERSNGSDRLMKK